MASMHREHAAGQSRETPHESQADGAQHMPGHPKTQGRMSVRHGVSGG